MTYSQDTLTNIYPVLAYDRLDTVQGQSSQENLTLENGQRLVRRENGGMHMTPFMAERMGITDEAYARFTDRFNARHRLVLHFLGGSLLPKEHYNIANLHAQADTVGKELRFLSDDEAASTAISGLQRSVRQASLLIMEKRSAEITTLAGVADLWVVAENKVRGRWGMVAAKLIGATPDIDTANARLLPVVSGNDGTVGMLPPELELVVFPLHELREPITRA